MSGIFPAVSLSGAGLAASSVRRSPPESPSATGLVTARVPFANGVAQIEKTPKVWDVISPFAAFNAFGPGFYPDVYQDANHYGEIFPATYYKGLEIISLYDIFAPFDPVNMVQAWKMSPGSDRTALTYTPFSFENSPPGRLLNFRV